MQPIRLTLTVLGLSWADYSDVWMHTNVIRLPLTDGAPDASIFGTEPPLVGNDPDEPEY